VLSFVGSSLYLFAGISNSSATTLKMKLLRCLMLVMIILLLFESHVLV